MMLGVYKTKHLGGSQRANPRSLLQPLPSPKPKGIGVLQGMPIIFGGYR